MMRLPTPRCQYTGHFVDCCMPRIRSALGLSILVILVGLISAPRAISLASADAPAPAAVTPDTLPVPTEPHALRAWLAQGTFKTWPHQSEARPAEDPHGDRAQVFLNPSLAASVKARKPIHHQGAAAVLEMSDENGLPWGWAVAVKTHPSSNHGRGWYWYQVKSGPSSGRTDFDGHMIPSDPDEAGLGVKSCLTCHVKGHDYVITSSLD